MNRTLSMMTDIASVCDDLRIAFYGDLATATDYRDSYIVCHAIEGFRDDPQNLMSENISELDHSTSKAAKTLTLRASCNDIVASIAAFLGISDSEVIRRILYYTQLNSEKSNNNFELVSLKKEVLVIKNCLIQALDSVNSLIVRINAMEENK